MAERVPREVIEKEYYRLAKKADARLRALEGYKYDKHYAPATQWAYAKAMRDIEKWSGEGKKRFNTKAPESYQSLIAKRNDIAMFLAMPTSTKRGITAIYEERVKTVNQRYGTNFTWQQFATFVESDGFRRLADKLGSKTLMYALGKLEVNNMDDLIEKANKMVVRDENLKNLSVRRLLEVMREIEN